MRKPALAFLAAAAVVLAGGQTVFADNIKYVSGTDPYYPTASRAVTLQLDPGGGTELRFVNPADGWVSITFSAECSVMSTVARSYLGIDILIDGVVVPPTGGDDAFCSSVNTTNVDSWTTASRTVAANLSAGAHRVKITAGVASTRSTTAGWIDDWSLLIAR